MQQYKIKEGGFKEIRKQLLIKMVPFVLLLAIFVTAINFINLEDNESLIRVLPIVIIIAAVSIGVGLYIGIKRQKALFASYILTISDNLITREQFNTPTISIYFNDIKEIIKSSKGAIVINGKDREDQIIILPQIENYAQLEETLNQIKPITTKTTTPFIQKYQILVSLFTVGLMLCFYTTTNKIVTVATGTALAVFLSWSLFKIRKNQNIDNKTKRSFWLVLVVITAVIARMIIILLGFR